MRHKVVTGTNLCSGTWGERVVLCVADPQTGRTARGRSCRPEPTDFVDFRFLDTLSLGGKP